MKAHYLVLLSVVGWWVSVWGQGQDVMLGVERAEAPVDQVAVPVVRWLELVGGVVTVGAEQVGEALGL